MHFNTLNAELNPICHLMALLGAHHIIHVSRVRVNAYSRLTVQKNTLQTTAESSVSFVTVFFVFEEPITMRRHRGKYRKNMISETTVEDTRQVLTNSTFVCLTRYHSRDVKVTSYCLLNPLSLFKIFIGEGFSIHVVRIIN